MNSSANSPNETQIRTVSAFTVRLDPPLSWIRNTRRRAEAREDAEEDEDDEELGEHDAGTGDAEYTRPAIAAPAPHRFARPATADPGRTGDDEADPDRPFELRLSFWPTLVHPARAAAAAPARLLAARPAARSRPCSRASSTWSASRRCGSEARRACSPARATAGSAAVVRFRPVTVTGRYDGTKQFLLDNRTSAGRVGYHVLTRSSSTSRSWSWSTVAGSLPAPRATGCRRSRSRGRDARGRGPRGPAARGRPAARRGRLRAMSWPRVIQRVDPPGASCALRAPVAELVVLLAPDATEGYVRDWQPLPRARARPTSRLCLPVVFARQRAGGDLCLAQRPPAPPLGAPPERAAAPRRRGSRCSRCPWSWPTWSSSSGGGAPLFGTTNHGTLIDPTVRIDARGLSPSDGEPLAGALRARLDAARARAGRLRSGLR